jgi:phosphatidylglycerol:prolipoprotein diacylglycerol transferase
MRQTLIRILFDQPWALWATDPATGLQGIGIAVVWCAIGLAWLVWQLVSTRGRLTRDTWASLAVWLGLLVVAHFSAPLAARLLPWTVFAPGEPPVPRTSLPLFGYGCMLLIGFVAAVVFSRRRARQVGMDPELILDLAVWLLVSGVLGGRLAYLLQYGHELFVDAQGRALQGRDAIIAAVNLSEGGLVLIGAMAGGAAGFFLFCNRRRIAPLPLADLVVPAVFIGEGFGRIGCLLNGCCFGDACSLPWEITFPQGSVPFRALVQRGFVDPEALTTMSLHPTQVYSSINAFVLALVTATYYWRRRHNGDVLALACILYPITRFTLEFLRGDEMGQLGTGLTISQLYSLAILIVGLALLAWVSVRGTPATSTSLGGRRV